MISDMISVARAGLLVAAAMLAMAPAAAAPATPVAPSPATAAAAQTTTGTTTGVRVSNAWLRLPAVSGRPGGGFFTIAGGSSADRLLAVGSPAVERIELHETTGQNGRMSMRALDSVAVPAGGTVEFAPGGRHLMLFGVQPTVQAGDRVPLLFSFESGAKLTVEAEARSPAARRAATGMAPPPAHRQH